MNGYSMRINEILIESPEDVKLLLSILGYDINTLSKSSSDIKQQYNDNPSQMYETAMKSYLTKINMILIEMANLSQWASWIEMHDGQQVMREIEDVYNDNVEFMKTNKY